MFDPTADADDKLRELRSDFEACVDSQEDAMSESHRAARFYHNTNNEGQWEEGDLEYLRENGRVAFSFNLCKSKVDTFIGMVKDVQRKAQSKPAGGEDAFLAEILDKVTDQIEDSSDYETKESAVLRDGSITRESGLRVVVERDAENPQFLSVKLPQYSCYEIHWDPASREPGRDDARFVFFDKWLDKGEFQRLYPDADFDDIIKMSDVDDHLGFGEDDRSEGFNYGTPDDNDRYDGRRWERYYWNRRHKKIRVIHAEYKVPELVYWLIDTQAGVTEEVSAGIHKNLAEIQAGGMLEGLQPAKTWRDVIYTVQWVGPEILFDGKLDQPYDGFSFVPFTYAIDSETGCAYSMLRNLFDPQMETNKAHSASLETQMGQSKPGVIAEKGALEDANQFEDQMRITGGVAIVKDGALAERRVIERSVAQASPAHAQRLQDGVAMLDKIANISTDLASPAAQAEAGATVQLRYRKSQLGMSDQVDAFEAFQKSVKRRLLQIVIRAMPSDQIATILGNGQKYQVQDTPEGKAVIEVDPASGQPKNQALLEKIRTMRYDVTLEVSSENTTLRLLEAQGLVNLAQIGQPVDPAVLFDKMVSSRAERERLIAFAEQAQQAQAQQAQQTQQLATQQLDQTLQIEAAKGQETTRHNMATEGLDAIKQQSDYQVKMATVLERADASEKRALAEVMKAVEARQDRRSSIPVQHRRVEG
jgi:hypothetical protein